MVGGGPNVTITPGGGTKLNGGKVGGGPKVIDAMLIGGIDGTGPKLIVEGIGTGGMPKLTTDGIGMGGMPKLIIDGIGDGPTIDNGMNEGTLVKLIESGKLIGVIVIKLGISTGPKEIILGTFNGGSIIITDGINPLPPLILPIPIVICPNDKQGCTIGGIKISKDGIVKLGIVMIGIVGVPGTGT